MAAGSAAALPAAAQEVDGESYCTSLAMLRLGGTLDFYAVCGFADQAESALELGGRRYVNRRLRRALTSIA